MLHFSKFSVNLALTLAFSRPVLVFCAFACTLWFMFTEFTFAYLLGLTLLGFAMLSDWGSMLITERVIPNSRLAPIMDRMTDRLTLSILFPVLGAGMIWRFHRLDALGEASRGDLLHALFVLSICVLVLMRDQFVQFLRGIAARSGEYGESYPLSRLRTLVFSPMAVMLYAYAFHPLQQDGAWLHAPLRWLDQIPLRAWFVLEICFLVINIASITAHLRKYGPMALDDITEDDQVLRQKILSVIPHSLTLLNAVLGVSAIVFSGQGRIREAVLLLIGALVLDRLDGLVARQLGLTEPPPGHIPPRVPLGMVLDDVADSVSFCIAPAAIAFLSISAIPQAAHLLPFLSIAALLYALAGIFRLTRFTFDTRPVPGFFKGMPVPAAAMWVAASVEITTQLSLPFASAWATFTVALMCFTALLMNLFPIRYLHGGRLASRHPMSSWVLLGFLLTMFFTPYFGFSLFGLSLIYAFSPIITRNIDPQIAQREHPLLRVRGRDGEN